VKKKPPKTPEFFKNLPPDVLEFFRKEGAKGGKKGGRKGGLIGGKRSLVTMTPEERSERASKAGLAAAKKRKAKAKTPKGYEK
jgi:hypothetical protein